MKKASKALTCMIAGVCTAVAVLPMQAEAGKLPTAGAGDFSGVSNVVSLPEAGISSALNNYYADAPASDVEVIGNLVPSVKSEYKDTAIAKVESYVNIRNKAGEDGQVLGKLYNESAAEIIGEDNGWYEIKSGTVMGYVKKEYVVTGVEAEKLAETAGNKIATVNTKTLKVRESSSTDSAILTLVPEFEELDVIEVLDGWVKVAVDSDLVGFVSKDFVEIRTEFVQAESLQEEEARLKEEEQARLEAQAAAEEAARLADEAAKAEKAAREAAEREKAAKEAKERERAEKEAAEREEAERKAEEARKAAEEAARKEEAAEKAAKEAEEAAKKEEEAKKKEEQDTKKESSETDKSDADKSDADESDADESDEESGESAGSRQKVVSYALKFVGNPYRYGGTSLTNGADCSGFVQSVLGDCGYSIPRSSRSQASSGKRVSLDEIKPGDLIFYSRGGSINHVALYIGNGQVVHASSRKTGIKISKYNYRTPVKAVSYID